MIGRYKDKFPAIAPSAYVSPTAEVYGDVVIGEQAVVMFFSSIRGDINFIRVGAFTNIQENCVLHVSDDYPSILEEWVTLGHGAIVHGATVRKGALIGIRSVVLDGSEIGEEAFVASGAVVTPGTKVLPRTLVAGIPAKFVRELKEEEIEDTYRRAKRYIELLGPSYKDIHKGAHNDSKKF